MSMRGHMKYPMKICTAKMIFLQTKKTMGNLRQEKRMLRRMGKM